MLLYVQMDWLLLLNWLKRHLSLEFLKNVADIKFIQQILMIDIWFTRFDICFARDIRKFITSNRGADLNFVYQTCRVIFRPRFVKFTNHLATRSHTVTLLIGDQTKVGFVSSDCICFIKSNKRRRLFTVESPTNSQ